MTDLMTVCGRLTEIQRLSIIENFCRFNRHWRGAQVEDIIDALDDTDAYCGLVEEAWVKFPDLQQEGFGAAARCLITAGEEITEEALKKLLEAT